MKLIGNLKKQVEKAQTKDEARDIIEKAGMKLTDDDLNMVVGGCQINAISGPGSVFGCLGGGSDGFLDEQGRVLK